MIQFPRPLKTGQTVAVTAPSSGLSTEAQRARLDLVLQGLREQGFEVKQGKCLRTDHKHVSAPAAQRASELMCLLLDPSVAAIIPPWGGELASELLTLLDWDALAAAQPKWLLGYSDTSTLLMALTLRLGWATAHGPCLMDLAPTQSDTLTPWALRALQHPGPAPLVQHSSTHFQTQWTPFEQRVDAPFDLTEPSQWRRLGAAQGPVAFSGRLIGGCLDTVAWLAGSVWGDVPSFRHRHQPEGVILYFENAEMSPCALMRCLLSLQRQGWFEGLSGLLIGRSAVKPVTDPQALTEQEVLLRVFEGAPYPVLVDVDIGHQPPQMTLINGALAHVSFDPQGSVLTQTLGTSVS